MGLQEVTSTHAHTHIHTNLSSNQLKQPKIKMSNETIFRANYGQTRRKQWKAVNFQQKKN